MKHQTLYTIHGIDEEHLADVKAEMITLGAPEVRVVDCGDYLMALEGTHRIAAAVALGIEPKLIMLGVDDLVDPATLDWTENMVDEQYPAGDLAGEIYTPRCGIYRRTDGAWTHVR